MQLQPKSAQISDDEKIDIEWKRRKNLAWSTIIAVILVLRACFIKTPDQLLSLGVGIMMLLSFMAFHCKWEKPYDHILQIAAKAFIIILCIVCALYFLIPIIRKLTAA